MISKENPPTRHEKWSLAAYTERRPGIDYVQLLNDPFNPALRLFEYLKEDGVMKSVTGKNIFNNTTKKNYLQIKGPKESIKHFTEVRWMLNAHPDFVALTNAFYGKNPHSLGASEIMSVAEKGLVISFALQKMPINEQTDRTRKKLQEKLGGKEIPLNSEELIKLIDHVITTVMELPRSKMNQYLLNRYQTTECDLI